MVTGGHPVIADELRQAPTNVGGGARYGMGHGKAGPSVGEGKGPLRWGLGRGRGPRRGDRWGRGQARMRPRRRK